MPPRLILASGSPRRRELLGHLGVPFEVVVSGFDESSLTGARPEALTRQLAAAKAAEVAALYPYPLVLAADTVVVYRGELLGKPEDAAEARRMLRRLRGRVHRVITGVGLASPGRARPRLTHVVARVRMREYSEAEIEAWIARGEPFDKAGAYGIQDAVFQPVQAIEGCFCNVMGMPVWTVARLLLEAGVAVTTTGLPERCWSCPLRGE